MRSHLQQLTGIETKKKKGQRESPRLPGPPDPDDPPRLNASGLEYMIPRFDQDITHEANQTILDKAAELALAAIQVSCVLAHLSITLTSPIEKETHCD
jgi:hypothetical protein